jgi:hypothetical protein
MAHITIKKTPLTNKLVLVEKQYELYPEILALVMSYFAPSVEKHLHKMGIAKLHDMCKKCCRIRFTNINVGELEERKMLLIDPLMKYHIKHDLMKKYPDIGAKRVLKTTRTDTTGFSYNVGDLVNYRQGGTWWGEPEGGVIVKITECKYHIQLYVKKVISKARGDIIDTTIHSWEDKIATKIVRVTCGFHKVDNYLIKTTHDWGR